MTSKHGSAQDRTDAKALLEVRPDFGDPNHPEPVIRRLERWRGELGLGPLDDASQDERTAHYLALADLIGPGRGKDLKRIACLMVCRQGLATPLYREFLVEHFPTTSAVAERWAQIMELPDAERHDLIDKAEFLAYEDGFDSEPTQPVYKLFVAIMETMMSNLSRGVPTEFPEELLHGSLTESLTRAFGAAPADPETQARAVGYQGEVPPQLAEFLGAAAIPFPKAAGEIASSGNLHLLARMAQSFVPVARMVIETSSVSMTEEELLEACALIPPMVLAFFAVGPMAAIAQAELGHNLSMASQEEVDAGNR
jgi:hypothetical protein